MDEKLYSSFYAAAYMYGGGGRYLVVAYVVRVYGRFGGPLSCTNLHLSKTFFFFFFFVLSVQTAIAFKEGGCHHSRHLHTVTWHGTAWLLGASLRMYPPVGCVTAHGANQQTD